MIVPNHPEDFCATWICDFMNEFESELNTLMDDMISRGLAAPEVREIKSRLERLVLTPIDTLKSLERLLNSIHVSKNRDSVIIYHTRLPPVDEISHLHHLEQFRFGLHERLHCHHQSASSLLKELVDFSSGLDLVIANDRLSVLETFRMDLRVFLEDSFVDSSHLWKGLERHELEGQLQEIERLVIHNALRNILNPTCRLLFFIRDPDEAEAVNIKVNTKLEVFMANRTLNTKLNNEYLQDARQIVISSYPIPKEMQSFVELHLCGGYRGFERQKSATFSFLTFDRESSRVSASPPLIRSISDKKTAMIDFVGDPYYSRYLIKWISTTLKRIQVVCSSSNNMIARVLLYIAINSQRPIKHLFLHFLVAQTFFANDEGRHDLEVFREFFDLVGSISISGL